MASKDDFTKWQRPEATSQPTGQQIPVVLKWRASARTARRDRYNASQREAQRDGVIFRWVLAVAGILAILTIIIYVNAG
jgi:hypothetical protein